MPWGPIDPAEASGRPNSPIGGTLPDLLIASGRRAVPYVRAVKRLSRGETFTVILKDPRTGAGAADLIWVPSHDRLRGPNVIVTLTAPHRFAPERIAAARVEPDGRLRSLRRPWAAILVGGPSRHVQFGADDAERLRGALLRLALTGTALAITTSRRTPARVSAALRDLASDTGGFLWDGAAPNPLQSMLANADLIVVTADSTNMTGEALATGVPVTVFGLAGLSRRHAAFLAALEAQGLVRPFAGRLEEYGYDPLDSTLLIAETIRRGLDRHRAGS